VVCNLPVIKCLMHFGIGQCGLRSWQWTCQQADLLATARRPSMTGGNTAYILILRLLRTSLAWHATILSTSPKASTGRFGRCNELAPRPRGQVRYMTKDFPARMVHCTSSFEIQPSTGLSVQAKSFSTSVGQNVISLVVSVPFHCFL
jgi:hypothetical protein